MPKNDSLPLSAVLRKEQAARYIGVGRTTLCNMVSSGELEQIQLGPRAVGIRVATLDAWIASRPVISPKEPAELAASRATSARQGNELRVG